MCLLLVDFSDLFLERGTGQGKNGPSVVADQRAAKGKIVQKFGATFLQVPFGGYFSTILTNPTFLEGTTAPC